ncbi:MAG: hypothetical protein ACT4QA_17725 [Panacagrimonas sp.]
MYFLRTSALDRLRSIVGGAIELDMLIFAPGFDAMSIPADDGRGWRRAPALASPRAGYCP